jgi:hypothetical protein
LDPPVVWRPRAGARERLQPPALPRHQLHPAHLEAQLRGFGRNAWLTSRQAAELGTQVRGGERGTTAVFYKKHEVPAEPFSAA